MSSKEPGDRRFTTDALRGVMDEVAHLQVATTFHITDGNSERIFYFVKGGVRLLSSGPHAGPGLPGHLLETGRAGIDAIHAALEESRSRKKDLRQVLIDNNVLTKRECEEVVSRLIRDELFELVFWHDAIYMVHTQEPPEEIFKLDRPVLHGGIDNEQLTRDVLRWLDDWSRIQPLVPSDQIPVRTTGAGRDASSAAEPQIQRLLALCEEEVPLRQVWLSAGMPLDELCATIMDLEQDGMVALGPDDTTSRSPEEEIAALEDSLRSSIASDLVRERLASLYEKIKRPNKAVEHLEALAQSALSSRDIPRAAERYRVILQLQPQNVGAFEKLLDSSRNTQAAGDVKKFALAHLQRLASRSLGPEAERCATLLETFSDARHDVQEFKASLLAAKGRAREAALELVRLAGVHDEKGDLERAIECLRKALAYDDGNPDAQSGLYRFQERIRESEARKAAAAAAEEALRHETQEPVARRSATLGPRIAAAVVALAAIGGVVYFVLNRESSAVAAEDPDKALAQTRQAEAPSGDPPREDGAGDTGGAPPREDGAGDAGGGDVRRVRPPAGSLDAVVRRLFGRGAPAAREPRGTPERGGDAGRSGEAPPVEPRLWPGASPRAPDPCDPSNFRTRPLSSTHVAYYADACSLFIRDEKGKVAHEFPGKARTRWAFSRGGRFVCRWEPGEHPIVFTLPQGLEFPLSWRIPEFTGALAIGKDRIVVREHRFTAVFRFDGTPVTSANLPEWEEGVFVESCIVFTRQSETRALWVVQADDLDYLWSCHNEPEGLIVR